MGSEFHIVVCGSIVPDPLQTLAPQDGPAGPDLEKRNDASRRARPLGRTCSVTRLPIWLPSNPGSQVWLVSLGPKAKLQQVMMSVAQKVPFQLVVADGSASGFVDSYETAKVLADTIDMALPDWINPSCCFSAAGSLPRAVPARSCRWSARLQSA